MMRRAPARSVAPVSIAAVLTALIVVLPAHAESYRLPERGLIVEFRQIAPPHEASQTLRHIVDGVDGDEIALTATLRRGERTSVTRLRAFRFHLTSRVTQGRILFVIRAPTAELARLTLGDLGQSVTVNAEWVRADASTGEEALAKLEAFRTSVYTVTIERRERVRVPAGEFECVVVLRHDEWAEPGDDRKRINELRLWLVPELGWYVRAEERWIGIDVPTRIAEAIQVVRPR